MVPGSCEQNQKYASHMDCSKYYKCSETGKLRLRSCPPGRHFYADILKCKPRDPSRCAKPCSAVTDTTKVLIDSSSGEPEIETMWSEAGLTNGRSNSLFTKLIITTHSKHIPELTTEVTAGDTTTNSSNSEITSVEASPELSSITEVTSESTSSPRLNSPLSSTSRPEEPLSTKSRLEDPSSTTSRLKDLSPTVSRFEDTSSPISGEEDPSLSPRQEQDPSQSTTKPTGEMTDAQGTTTGPPVTKLDINLTTRSRETLKLPVWFQFRRFQSLWNLTGTSTAAFFGRMSNVTAIRSL